MFLQTILVFKTQTIIKFKISQLIKIKTNFNKVLHKKV